MRDICCYGKRRGPPALLHVKPSPLVLSAINCQIKWQYNYPPPKNHVSFLFSLVSACSAAARFPSDPQGSGYGLAAGVQGQRSEPQTSAGRQRHWRRGGGGQKRQKGRSRKRLTSASRAEACASLETSRMSQLSTFLILKTILTRSHTHMNITDCTCYMSTCDWREVMCGEETEAWGSVLLILLV